MALQLEVVTPDGAVVSTQADYLGIPGSNGNFGILPGHVSMLTSLDIGVLFYDSEGVRHNVFVAGGFVEVNDNKVIVLAEIAEKAENINTSRAEHARQRAKERLDQLRNDSSIDAARAQQALTRAIKRLNIARL